MDHLDRPDRSPVVAELLDDAYVSPVSVETAARHLWAIHKAAERLAAERAEDERAEDARWGRPDRHTAQPASLASGRRVPRAAVPLLVAVMVMSSSGMALAASQSSLPGDVLYPVKRGTETAQLIFTRNPEARAQLQLAFARARLEELRRIGQSRPQHVPALVSDITMSLTEVEQAAPEIAPASQALREETTEQIAALQLPVEITAAVDEVIAAATAAATSPSSTTTTAASATAAPTATEVPTVGGDTATESPIVGGPLTSDPAIGLEPTATPSPSPTSSPTASESASPSASPTTGPASSSGGTGQAAGDGSSAPAPQPEPSEPEPATTGTIVTPRPHPSGEGGESRAEDGTGESSGEATDGSTDDGSSEQTVVPFTRPE